MDVKAAYDNVDYNTLMDKLMEKKCPGKIISFVGSWLWGRKFQCIRKFSEAVVGNQRRELPQGAILSPILYNIYTADITKEIDTLRVKVLQYADDIGIYTTSNVRGKNIETMENVIKVIIGNLKKIKLEVSEEKSTIVNFTTKNNSRREKCAVAINEVVREEKKSTKFLGITLDNKLKFEEHITEVGLKAKRRLTMLRYIKTYKEGSEPGDHDSII